MMGIAAISACGRLQFDPPSDAASDGATTDGATTSRCDPLAPFTSVLPISELNSSMTDGALRLSADERIAYFQSNRDGLFQVYTASRAERDQPFGPVTRAFSDGTLGYWPTVASDGVTMVFTNTSGDLCLATRGSDQTFTNAGVISGLATVDSEDTAYFGPDDKLYFTRSQPVPTLHVAEPWPSLQSVVVVAGLESSTRDERAPVISGDERTIYFATQPDDIFVATRADLQSPFGAATYVPDVNTAMPEAPTWLSSDGCRLYFESFRTGEYVLYVAERAP
jgi:hypothetical protein